MSKAKKVEKEVSKISLKKILVGIIALLLFGTYVSILINGENSWSIFKQLQEEKSSLSQQEKSLKVQNQILQKEYFELKQLEPKD
ncbi:MAG: hypothetical protein QM493_03675 [Sulfurovum sp.]